MPLPGWAENLLARILISARMAAYIWKDTHQLGLFVSSFSKPLLGGGFAKLRKKRLEAPAPGDKKKRRSLVGQISLNLSFNISIDWLLLFYFLIFPWGTIPPNECFFI